MCWYCGSPVIDQEPFGRSLVCAECGKDIRACKNCRFYLSEARGNCSETNAEPVNDKERANFCDWFSLNDKYRKKTESYKTESYKTEGYKTEGYKTESYKTETEKSNAARTAFENLFS
ncbi:MAG: hypothetical protein FWH41_00440 [Treponema sp.]|nr:hypothetical protein [Treponema sp.]